MEAAPGGERVPTPPSSTARVVTPSTLIVSRHRLGRDENRSGHAGHLVGAHLECELLARRRFGSQAEARMALFRFIEGWYNPARRHSGLCYLAYEEMMPVAELPASSGPLPMGILQPAVA